MYAYLSKHQICLGSHLISQSQFPHLWYFIKSEITLMIRCIILGTNKRGKKTLKKTVKL